MDFWVQNMANEDPTTRCAKYSTGGNLAASPTVDPAGLASAVKALSADAHSHLPDHAGHPKS
jgi:hypothetical protein